MICALLTRTERWPSCVCVHSGACNDHDVDAVGIGVGTGSQVGACQFKEIDAADHLLMGRRVRAIMK